MKARLVLLSAFLVSQAVAGTVQLETGFYSIDSVPGIVQREGYERWKGKKSGLVYRLELEDTFRVKKDSLFKLSITSGNVFNPYVAVFTSVEDRISENNFHTFNVKELFLRKEHFIFKNLTFIGGKQLFDIPPFLSEYLWGGRFEYSLTEKLSFSWSQIAAYEGNYLLFNSEKEDDIDIFGGSISWKKQEGERISFGIYKLTDANGSRPGINKVTSIISYERKLKDGLTTSIFFANQDGNKAFVADIAFGDVLFSGGYAQKGFTSYGFMEGTGEFGNIFKPRFSNITYERLSISKELTPFRVKVYALHISSLSGEKEDELGGEIAYPFFGGELFLRAAAGSDSSHFIYSGYRYGTNIKRFFFPDYKLRLHHQFSITGEYADFSKRSYTPQSGYEGWERADHVGFWHSSYKLAVEGENWKLKLSTGKDSKLDYLVWGNTSDNWLLQKNHGKQWHFEEVSVRKENIVLGLQSVTIPGFISENLTGIRILRESFSIGGFYEQHADVEKGSSSAGYFLGSYKNKRFSLDYLIRSNGTVSKGTLSVGLNVRNFNLVLLKQSGESWGGVLSGRFKTKAGKLEATYRVYSKNFSTFGLKEYYRNVCFIERPGESNIRLVKVSLLKPLKLGIKEIDRLFPQIGLSYGKLGLFNGKYVGEEGAVTVSLKPGKRCQLNLTSAFGNRNSFFHGVDFSVKW